MNSNELKMKPVTVLETPFFSAWDGSEKDFVNNRSVEIFVSTYLYL